MITFIESGNRIATEKFETGEIYTITYTNGNYRTLCCIGIGTDFVMFQGTSPNALFCLTLGTSETVSSIELGGGGTGTMNYNELENKPQINGVVLIGNKTASDLNLVSQNELADYATNASVVSALASKQDTLTNTQLTAVNSGITSSLVTQITTNKNNISLNGLRICAQWKNTKQAEVYAMSLTDFVRDTPTGVTMGTYIVVIQAYAANTCGIYTVSFNTDSNIAASVSTILALGSISTLTVNADREIEIPLVSATYGAKVTIYALL